MIINNQGPEEPEAFSPLVALSGTFRRGLAELHRDHSALLDLGCQVLSPVDINFVDQEDGFVYAAHEVGDRPEAIEERHLRAIERADFVWLHAPGGYVGKSAALELGFAHANGTPVFTRHEVQEVGLRGCVQQAISPAEAVQAMAESQGEPPVGVLPSLQTYYARVATIRGYDVETPTDCLVLLMEELGELARGVRKQASLPRDAGYTGVDVATELADVQLYLLHLANRLKVDLGQAVAAKERSNYMRWKARSQAGTQAA